MSDQPVVKPITHLITHLRKAAGEVLTAKQAPHRPGTAPALGLRAGNDVSSLYRRPSNPGGQAMFLTNVLRRMRPRAARIRGGARPAPGRRFTARPLVLEALEERCVM